MADDVLINKLTTIERCVKRARDEKVAAGPAFATDFTRQDAAVLNVQRACEAALDIGQHLIRQHRLGVPQSARDVFGLLERSGRIDARLSASLQAMVGFRNVAVHDDRELQVPIVEAMIDRHLDDVLAFARQALRAP
jgi:uncharacterized protein YutE (UPF0331/DUF86 family)